MEENNQCRSNRLQNLGIIILPESSFTKNIAVSVFNIEDDVDDYYADNGTTKYLIMEGNKESRNYSVDNLGLSLQPESTFREYSDVSVSNAGVVTTIFYNRPDPNMPTRENNNIKKRKIDFGDLNDYFSDDGTTKLLPKQIKISTEISH
ncbi:unnamed protein product [Brachionus calyciflorus]|uniref:Uncharacterized protein n=1 Tax=Brachionus calyciflorus TaxID=104777 RepID=A0A813YJF9_9BILA|nr:unnamed protein product [Brachionus calyciflorus]